MLWKSVNPQTATANTVLTWTITYRNDTDLPIGDPGTGNGLTIREDAIPADTTYVPGSATSSGGCIIYYSIDDGATWTTTEPAPSQLTRIKWFVNQAIPAHAIGTVSFQTQVNSDVVGYPLICNTASAGVGDCPFEPSDTVCVNGGADLDILKVVDDHSPCEGGSVSYVVTVSNPSTTNATGVQVTDLLPSGLTYLGNSPSQGTYDSGTGLWNVGNLNASSSATLTLDAGVNTGTGGTTIINWAEITHSDQADPIVSNNRDHDGVAVHAAPAAYPASNSVVCEGGTIYLFGGPGGMTSYYWTGPGGFTSSEENPIRTNATLDMAGTYTLTITDSNGCGSGSASTSVTVNASNTPAGSYVEYTEGAMAVEFTEVVTGGCTSVTTSPWNLEGPLPTGLCPLLPYYEVVTTATYSGAIDVAIGYSDAGVQDESQLAMLHWDGTQWVDVTTSVDTGGNICHGQVSGLSPFIICYPCGSSGGSRGVDVYPSVFVGLVAAGAAGIAAYLVRRRLSRVQ